jgi:hypothetical protein
MVGIIEYEWIRPGWDVWDLVTSVVGNDVGGRIDNNWRCNGLV